MKPCPECGEPPHYHSWCTLCAGLFRAKRERPGQYVRFKRLKGTTWPGRATELAQLRRAGLTYEQMAAQFGVSRAVIAGAFHRHVRLKGGVAHALAS